MGEGGIPEGVVVADRPSIGRRDGDRKTRDGSVDGAAAGAIDDVDRRLRRRMEQTDIVSELFVPLDRASWKDGRLTLPKQELAEVRTQIAGVRFHAADPAGEDLGPERLCQQDVVYLVRSLRKLRAVTGGEDLVLSDRCVATRQPPTIDGARVKFGLARDERRRGRLRDETRAACVCHAAIRKAIRRSGFVILFPEEAFASATGLKGLEAWGAALRLGRRRRRWPWLLLLLLLPLAFLLGDCEAPPEFFGFRIETRSLIIVVDKSGSMGQHFARVRDEAREVLDRLRAGGGVAYADIIAFDDQARSALGGLTEIDAAASERLTAFIDDLAAGGGTRLESALLAAAQEVARHERPTTLVILTDGEDGSVAEMLADMDAVTGAFQGIEVVGHTLTPRLFAGAPDRTPVNDAERGLARLSEELKGRFGAEGDGE